MKIVEPIEYVPQTQANPLFKPLAVLFAFSVVAGVLLVKSSASKYDASTPCVFDSQYTELRRTSGSSRDVSYRVSYRFVIRGEQYSRTQTIFHPPTARWATVYYMAANPQDNSLGTNRVNNHALIAAGTMFLIGLIAYWRLPKDHIIVAVEAPSRVGWYDARFYIGIAFFAQVVIACILLLRVLSLVPGVSLTSYLALTLATTGAVSSTLWVYSGQWRYIEAYSSSFCSGITNLSILYVPVVAFFYANYRALRRLAAH